MQNDTFEEFYKRNFRLIYKICFTYLGNASDAEDCTEDVFVKVLSGKLIFNDEVHEKKWLTVTAINLCKDRLKSWKHKSVSSLDELEIDIPDESPFGFDETLSVVMKLPRKYKDVIILHYYMDYKTEEIARLLKRPSSTIRNHLKEARELLKSQLGEL
jgi:RNA polymerase sigma factor, sigma-70 family